MLVDNRRFANQVSARNQRKQALKTQQRAVRASAASQQVVNGAPSLSTAQFNGLIAAQTKLNSLGLGHYGDFAEQLRRPPPPPPPRQPAYRQTLQRYDDFGNFNDFGATWVGKNVMLTFGPWWEVDGVPCGGVANVAHNRTECERRDAFCREKFPGIWAQCFKQCPGPLGLNVAPWTEVGRGCRNLPLLPGQEETLWSGGARFMTKAGEFINPPSIDELDPVVLARTMITNPARYGIIIMWATGGLAITLPVVTAEAIGKGRNIQQVLESIGGVLIAPFIPVVLALGITQAVKRGGWDYAWDQIVGPALEIAGEVAEAVIAFLTGGPIAGLAAGLRFMGRHSPDAVVAAILQAAADCIGVVIQAINEGPAFLKQTTLYVSIGNALVKIAGSLPAGVVRELIILWGTALSSLAVMISLLFKGDFNGAKNEAVKQILGIDLETLNKTTKADRDRLLVPNQSVIKGFEAVINIVQAIIKALSQAAKFLSISPLMNFLNSVNSSLASFIQNILGFVANIAPPPGPPPPPPIPPEQQIAMVRADADAAIRQMQDQLAREQQARKAAEAIADARAKESDALRKQIEAMKTALERAAQTPAQPPPPPSQQGGGTGLALAAAAAAAFLT